MKLLFCNLSFWFFFLLPLLFVFDSFQPISATSHGKIGGSRSFILGGNLAPWKTGFLQFPLASGPAYAPDGKFPLVLAAKRTNRPDILRGFRHYRSGWDITNKHYWAVQLDLFLQPYGLFLSVWPYHYTEPVDGERALKIKVHAIQLVYVLLCCLFSLVLQRLAVFFFL